MNPSITALFHAVTDDLLQLFGRAMIRTDAEGNETAVRAVLAESTEGFGDFGERRGQQWTLELSSASGAVVGDMFTCPGTPTADDPYPDDEVWVAAQLIIDDGYTRKFAVRREAA